MSNQIIKIKEQDDVLNTYNKNIIVSASAGSGKTSVMIRKIVNLILNKDVHVKDLLVLTYTNAAADEMKQKLIKSINETAINNNKLLSELDDIPLSDISTFDSFCQKVVKRYFYVLDIDPGFNILQGSELTQVQNLAMKRAINNFKKKNPQQYLELFELYASNRTDNNIYNLVLKLYEFTSSILDYENFKQKSFMLFDKQNGAEKFYLDYLKQECLYFNQIFQDLHKKASNLFFTKYCVYINDILSVINVILKENDFSVLVDKMSSFEKQVLRKEIEDDNFIEEIKIQRDYFYKLIDNIKDYKSSKMLEIATKICKQNTQTLFQLCDDFIVQYEKIKKQKNFYDYNDVERLTIKLLQNEEIQNSIKKRYKYIFVDEFQDANAIQEKIIMLLKNGDNLFFVGDLKQAIYGFRQSNSKIFEKLNREFEQDSKHSVPLSLNSNFRTTKQILVFINNIFNEIMLSKTASLDYKNKAQLQSRANYKPEKNPCVEVDVLYSDKTKLDVSKVYRIDKDDSFKRDINKAECNFVAEKITKLLDEEIYDAQLKKYRKITYKDICILIRTRTNQSTLVSVLNSFNIPTIENSNDDLEMTYDASLLINVLRVSQNFKNDIALASVMMSDLFNFDSQEMLEIRNNCDCKYFYDCVLNYDKNDKIYEKILKMQEVLHKFYEISIFDNLSNAFTYLVNTQNYEYKISTYKNGRSRIKNVNDFIKSFNDNTFNYSPTEYLNFLDKFTRQKKVIQTLSCDDVVTITTMHASKGLEWPVVICMELSNNFNRKPKMTEIMLNEDYGLGVKFYYKQNRKKYSSIFYDVIKIENSANEFAEKLRLLYVAMTRAKNRLILVGQKNNFRKFENEKQISSTQNFFDLIINSFTRQDINKINNCIQTFNLYENKDFVCNVYDELMYFNFAPQKIEVKKNDNVLPQSKLLKEYINKQYFNQDAKFIAQKNSVSSILKQQEFASLNFAPNKLTTTEHYNDIKQNELGLAYHKIIELCDFDANIDKDYINNIINDIRNKNIFEKKVLDSIDIDIVLKNINILQNLAKGNKVLKEHTFIMQVPYNEIQNSNIDDFVLVQGICDLIIIKENEIILVDYKFSSLNDSALIQKYNKQLFLYKKAIEYGLNATVSKCYILSLKQANLIELTPHK